MRAVVVRAEGVAELDEAFDEAALDGDVLLDVLFSSYNFKDGLAIAGKGVVRSFPLIPGIDVVGRVVESADPRWAPGQVVVLNGDGAGENRNGGFATRARVRPGSLVALPDALDARRAAAIGTAGFTAMIAVLKLADVGVRPEDGDILVTGSAGGVGSVAISLLARRGYSVTASTGRAAEHGDYLRGLGATAILDRAELSEGGGRPLQERRWAGAVDSVGSTTLANILAQVAYGGTVVACGLAQGADLPTTVLPFILRDVTLTGANSVEAPVALRERAWAALAQEVDTEVLDGMTVTIGLDETIGFAPEILAGRTRGRTVVEIASA